MLCNPIMNMTNNLDYLLFNYDACERGLFKNIMTLNKKEYIQKLRLQKKQLVSNYLIIIVDYILTFSSHKKNIWITFHDVNAEDNINGLY